MKYLKGIREGNLLSFSQFHWPFITSLPYHPSIPPFRSLYLPFHLSVLYTFHSTFPFFTPSFLPYLRLKKYVQILVFCGINLMMGSTYHECGISSPDCPAQCDKCGGGFYLPPMSSQCQSCPQGTWRQMGMDYTSCVQCPPNTDTLSFGASAPTDCVTPGV